MHTVATHFSFPPQYAVIMILHCQCTNGSQNVGPDEKAQQDEAVKYFLGIDIT